MLTNDLNITMQGAEKKEGWSIRKLLSSGGSIGKVVSSFNPFEFILFVMILIAGLAELLGKDVSTIWYVLIFVLLFLGFIQRNSSNIEHKDK